MNFLGHEIVLLDFNYTISLINNLCVFIQMNSNKDQNIFFDDIVRTQYVQIVCTRICLHALLA